MSDHGDYKEPKAGDWMLVIERGGDVVDCLKVADTGEAVANPSPVATMSDGSIWAVETGEPIHRKWAGHYLWPCTKGVDYTDAMEMLAAASPDAFGQVYGILLRDKRAREATENEVPPLQNQQRSREGNAVPRLLRRLRMDHHRQGRACRRLARGDFHCGDGGRVRHLERRLGQQRRPRWRRFAADRRRSEAAEQARYLSIPAR